MFPSLFFSFSHSHRKEFLDNHFICQAADLIGNDDLLLFESRQQRSEFGKQDLCCLDFPRPIFVHPIEEHIDSERVRLLVPEAPVTKVPDKMDAFCHPKAIGLHGRMRNEWVRKTVTVKGVVVVVETYLDSFNSALLILDRFE